MLRLKSHLWPACTLCRQQESFKKLVKYVRGRGGEAPGGAPDGRCPKCRTVAHRLHFRAHFGKWFLLTFVDSSAKTKKMRSPKGVKNENHVKYGTFAKDGFSPKTHFSRKAVELLHVAIRKWRRGPLPGMPQDWGKRIFRERRWNFCM